MSTKDLANLYSNIFKVALFTIWQMTQCIVLTVQCFYLRGNKGPFFLLLTRNKTVANAFHENERLNIGNQYHRDATKVASGIIEKFEEPHNIIPHRIDETVKERQMKYQKIVQALYRILYLIQKQGISYQRTLKLLETATPCEIQEIF